MKPDALDAGAEIRIRRIKVRVRASGCALAFLLATVSGTAARAEPQEPMAPNGWCAQTALDHALVQHVRARHLLDAHSLAQVLLAACPTSPLRFRWRVLDALVLDQLDEPMRAQQSLFEVVTAAPPPERDIAATLLARSHLTAGDELAFAQALGRLDRPRAVRLLLLKARDQQRETARVNGLLTELGDPRLSAAAVGQLRLYEEAARTRRPWLAASLSALIPGAGQAYAGSWQGAAVAFVLNAVLIGATVELAYRDLFVSAGAAGLAASIFYVGNILSAADLAARRNEQAALPHSHALERMLIPEAYP